MTQTIQNTPAEDQKKQKKPSRFDNIFFDALYNVITYIPVAIISWILSTLDLER